MRIRRFKESNADELSDLIAKTLRITNSKDYSNEYIEDNVKTFSPEFLINRSQWTHLYVVCEKNKMIGCGIIFEKGEGYYTYLNSIFDGINNIQKEYNRHVSDCACCIPPSETENYYNMNTALSAEKNSLLIFTKLYPVYTITNYI